MPFIQSYKFCQLLFYLCIMAKTLPTAVKAINGTVGETCVCPQNYKKHPMTLIQICLAINLF